LTKDELASQELAQWREKENLHQLEMIKKSELELLTLGQTFILKSHKGEEVRFVLYSLNSWNFNQNRKKPSLIRDNGTKILQRTISNNNSNILTVKMKP